MQNTRVRFAPSPTGPLHIGGLRTALYNYLFAKKHKGSFVLRIEDTDQKRWVKGAEQYIINTLKWCGIEPDEGVGYGGEFGPYKQSERKEIYQQYAQQLIDSGYAYYAFDTPDELDKLRKQAEQNNEVFTYNSLTRKQLNNSLTLDHDQVKQKLKQANEYVIRFKIPENQTIILTDIIRGNIPIQTNSLDDKILFKSDGMPTYHLANVVDDYLMQITHVIRGEEWLPSLALHHLLYEAFDWKKPEFAHLPLILKPEGKGKLSKRDGDKYGFPVFPLEWTDPANKQTSKGYKEEHYLPQALINFLAMLGWNPGTEQEIFSLKELIQHFDFKQVSKSGARFSVDKIRWYNQQYLQQQTNQDLLASYQTILKQNNITSNPSYDLQVIDLMKERANFVSDILAQGRFFYQAPTSFDSKSIKKAWKADSQQIIDDFVIELQQIKAFNSDNIQQQLKQFVQNKQIGFGAIMMPLRLLLTGSLQGPDIPISMQILGQEQVIKRLKNNTPPTC